MSAQPITAADTTVTPRLRVVRVPGAAVSTLGFAVIVLLLVAAGLGAVMVVTTSVGAQSRELAALRRESTELGYTQAALTSQLQKVSSANALALRASQLGMVPNPYPAFIHLADGTVTGVPTPVTGDELPFLRGRRSEAPPASATVTTPRPVAPSPQLPDDLVAAGTTGA
ncbi:hypothetical protein [Tessaracoccus sp. Z1128]